MSYEAFGPLPAMTPDEADEFEPAFIPMAASALAAVIKKARAAAEARAERRGHPLSAELIDYADALEAQVTTLPPDVDVTLDELRMMAQVATDTEVLATVALGLHTDYIDPKTLALATAQLTFDGFVDRSLEEGYAKMPDSLPLAEVG